MKKLSTILLSLFIAVAGVTQDSIVTAKHLDISISAVGFGGDYVTNSSGIQAGVEFKLSNYLGLQCDMRYIFDVTMTTNYAQFHVNVDKLKGVALNTELKRYLGQFKDEYRGGYIAGQIIAMYTNSHQGDKEINRIKIGLYSTVGYKYIAKSGFLFETSFGLGPQIIISNSTDIIPTGYYKEEEFPWSNSYDSGTSILPDLSWNIRFGWRF